MLKQEDAATLVEIFERSLRVLTEAEDVIFGHPRDEVGDALAHAYADVITDILQKLRAPLVIQYPDLNTHTPAGPPDTLLDEEEQETVDQLSPGQVQSIDDALLAECVPSWRKVARVIGVAIQSVPGGFPEVSAGYYAQRVIFLVLAGRLQSQGNLEYMRFSEVRLPDAGAAKSQTGAE
jgi:hypothetical protein